MKRTKLVEKKFKLWFGLKLCLLTITGMGAVTALLYLFASSEPGNTYGEAISIIYDLKVRIFPLIFASFYSLFILGVVTAAIAVMSVSFSHRIAGPIYRVEQSLKAMSAGDLTVVTRFRPKDQLGALEEELNGMVRALNHRVRNCADALSEIEQAEQNLAELLKEAGPAQAPLAEALEGLKLGVAELKRNTTSVKLKN